MKIDISCLNGTLDKCLNTCKYMQGKVLIFVKPLTGRSLKAASFYLLSIHVQMMPVTDVCGLLHPVSPAPSECHIFHSISLFENLRLANYFVTSRNPPTNLVCRQLYLVTNSLHFILCTFVVSFYTPLPQNFTFVNLVAFHVTP